MDQQSLQFRARRLQGAAAMGGFVITLSQAQSAVLRSEQDNRSGQGVSFEQARAEVRQLNHSRSRHRS